MKERFGIYLILTDPVTGYGTAAKAAVDCGVRYLQLRMKNTPVETVLKTAVELRKITRNTRTRFIINDHLDIAMECDADGIHLGQDDLSLPEARAKWNQDGKLFGLSTHSMEQATQAVESSPDYIGIGPVYPTATKPDTAPVIGPAETARIARSTPITSVAIGGITANNLPELLGADIQNYCVVSAVNQSPNPVAAIRELQNIWKGRVF